MERETGRQSLLKQAALNQHNVIIVCGMALFSLAVVSPLPLLIALGGEVVWLIVAPRTAAFGRRAASHAQRQEERQWRAEVDRAAARLEPALEARVRAAGAALEEVGRLAVESDAGAELGAEKSERLEQVLRAFTGLIVAEQALARMIGAGRGPTIEEEIARIERALVDERDGTVRMSLRQQLALSQRRLKQVEHVGNAQRALQVKLSLLETSLDYLRTQLKAGTAPGTITATIDEMLAAAQFNPDITSEAARSLSHARMTAINHPVISPGH